MLAADGRMLGFAENNVARDHSGWLHPAIGRLMAETQRSFKELQAVAVTAGPGSYTGLRVGMAAAKGICFARSVPLITCNSLLLMAASMVPLSISPGELMCPMIDARRLEVFTAFYTHELKVVSGPSAMILDKTSFERELAGQAILFSGSGAAKWQKICEAPSARFIAQPDDKQSFISIATDSFLKKSWADTVYSEPEYGKEFHTHVIN